MFKSVIKYLFNGVSQVKKKKWQNSATFCHFFARTSISRQKRWLKFAKRWLKIIKFIKYSCLIFQIVSQNELSL